MDERIAIADMRRAGRDVRAGRGVRAIARTLGGAPGTISRGPRRNVAEIGGVYGPHRAQQMATTAPDAPSHARSCPAHDRGTRPRPAPTSTGAPNRPAAGSDAATRIMEA